MPFRTQIKNWEDLITTQEAIRKGLLRKLLRDAELTIEEFLKLLNRNIS